MIKAVIFDMDGVLIDSEPLWREAEIEVFRKVGINLNSELCRQTTGLRTDEAVAHWYSYKPWKGKSQEEVGREIEEAVCDIIDKKGEAARGVTGIIGFFKSMGLPMALASSSSPGVIGRILNRLGLLDQFGIIHSAAHEDYGKPHPAVYITTAVKLGVDPAHCLAIEDSLAGLIAAKAARMRAMAVPEESNRTNPRFGIADICLDSLADFTASHWEMLNSLNGLNE
ncbi:MAG: hexitol phosphatase HxpB [Marinilabiliales bacterium]|nr:MAG: hexitol phosphatase HxpB [Marinilabiliales bacterium]